MSSQNKNKGGNISRIIIAILIVVVIIMGGFILYAWGYYNSASNNNVSTEPIPTQDVDITLLLQEVRELHEQVSQLNEENERLRTENVEHFVPPTTPATEYVAESTPVPTPIPTAEPTPPPTRRFYLESDIFAAETEWWNGHPANGSFTMSGTTFHTGVTIENTFSAPSSRRLDGTMTGPLFGRATYDIAGLGITYLIGTLGSVSNITGGSLTVSCADTGRFLGGGDVSGGQNATLNNIVIEIPTDVQRVTLLLQTPRAWNGPGFGNAFFE
ncbi:MAG: cell division protein ZapB [Firmicutes bacterium]|nr:cell division protein ZapB [Bacillota bacterium]